MSVCRFTGGPLDGQEREIDVYVPEFPVTKVERDEGFIQVRTHYYINVNTVIIDRELRNGCFANYVYHDEHRRVVKASA
jgi:hypothetical protein